MGGRGREDEGELSSNISGHLGPWDLPQHQLTHLHIITVKYTANTHTRGMQHIFWRAKRAVQYYFTYVLARIYNHVYITVLLCSYSVELVSMREPRSQESSRKILSSYIGIVITTD